MAYDRFLIAPFKSGLISEVKAWQIPEDAFVRLRNVYIDKGVVRKRFGSTFMQALGNPLENEFLASRLRINIGTTDALGALSGFVPGSIFKVGQKFSIGLIEFTVTTAGVAQPMITNGASTTHTFNTVNGQYVIIDSLPNTDMYFYPAEPVMGFSHYEENMVEENTTYAFDTQFIYYFAITGWEREGAVVFKGNNADFFCNCNWRGIESDVHAMFLTNWNVTAPGPPAVTDDPMYYYAAGAWNVFEPVIKVVANQVDKYVKSARIIIPFKNRLLLLSTVEHDVTTNTNSLYSSRCRFSRNGSPLPADTTNPATLASMSAAWLTGDQSWTVGAKTIYSQRASFIDAPTSEEIKSAAIIKDRLIVYFEHSIWEIVDTGSEAQPFVWQQINSEFGTGAMNSLVPFDKAIFAFGNNAIHACSGLNAVKINNKIGDATYDLRLTENGADRICVARDFYKEMVYWSYPSTGGGEYANTFPNKILAYNYEGDTWSVLDDCITAFGNYQGQEPLTWETALMTWGEAGFRWDEDIDKPQYRQIIGGNQQGFTFKCDSEITTNEHVLQITAIANYVFYLQLTIIDHSLMEGDYIHITNLNLLIVPGAEGTNFHVNVIDKDTVRIAAVGVGIYDGKARASRVNQIDILSKEWNFYIDKARNFYLAKIDFAVARTEAGEIAVDYRPSATNISIRDAAVQTDSILGSNILQTYPYEMYPLEDDQSRLWHSIYFQVEGECVQIRLAYTIAQIINPQITDSDFRLEGLMVYAKPTSGRLQ